MKGFGRVIYQLTTAIFLTPSKLIAQQKWPKRKSKQKNKTPKQNKKTKQVYLHVHKEKDIDLQLYFQEHSQVMGDTGPIMHWWLIYTNSVALKPLLWLSAVQNYCISSSFNLEIQTQSIESITEAQHYKTSLVLLNCALVPGRLHTFIVLHR